MQIYRQIQYARQKQSLYSSKEFKTNIWYDHLYS